MDIGGLSGLSTASMRYSTMRKSLFLFVEQLSQGALLWTDVDAVDLVVLRPVAIATWQAAKTT